MSKVVTLTSLLRSDYQGWFYIRRADLRFYRRDNIPTNRQAPKNAQVIKPGPGEIPRRGWASATLHVKKKDLIIVDLHPIKFHLMGLDFRVVNP